MITASGIKFIQSLRQKKYRDRHGVFVAEGDKIVRELADSHLQIEMVCGLKGWVSENAQLLPAETTCFTISEKQLSRLSNLKTPNQVLAVVKKPDTEALIDEKPENLVLVLDKLQDPGNLGTIIRTADWFGIRNIFCSHDTADVYNPKVIQSTMGSFIRTRIVYTELKKLLEKTGMNVYGAFLEGTSLYETKPDFPAALVIGNESGGISADIEPYITSKVFIPRHAAGNGTAAINGSGEGNNPGVASKNPGAAGNNPGVASSNPGVNGPESLNAAIAAGIMMSWFRM